MSRSRRERAKARVLLARLEGAPEYSQETLARLAALQQYCQPGKVYKVAMLHEQFCVNALKAGAKKCLCRPEIKIVTANETEERFQNAYRNHWMTQEGL